MFFPHFYFRKLCLSQFLMMRGNHMIFFDENSKIFYLENESMTYAFGIRSDLVTQHLWFGKRTGHDLAYDSYFDCAAAHVVKFPLDDGTFANLNHVPREFHQLYTGDFGMPSLMLERENGVRRFDFSFRDYQITKEKAPIPGMPSLRAGGGSESLSVRYECDGIFVTLLYTIYEDCNVVARSMKIENRSDTPIYLNRAASFSFSLVPPQYNDMACRTADWTAVYLSGGSGSETNVQKTPLSRGTFTIDSRRGASSASLNPFLGITPRETTETTGTAYGINLIWSGSFTLHAEVTANRCLRLSGGIEETGFRWKLNPGDMFCTPEAVLAFSTEGLSGLSWEYHTLYREHLIPTSFAKKPRPVVLNHWEATRFNYSGDILRQMVDATSEIPGIDTFVIDDGWFGKRNDISSGLGDWVVNEEKLGTSLREFSDYVHKKGMNLGIWFEPEMISEDSDLCRAHPEWAITTPNYTTLRGRGQMMLDLVNPEAVNYISSAVNRIIRDSHIEYVKWDRNRDSSEGYSPSLPPDQQGEEDVRQTLGFYSLCEKIINENPNVLFEGCASGGGRVDAGMLYYFPQIWISDQTDAHARTFIQYGASLCYPLSSHSCHVSRSPNRRAGHVIPLSSRGDIAALGMLGYELDIRDMSKDECQQISDQISAYRRDEPLILEGRLFRLSSPAESNYFAFELVSPDKTKVRITVMRQLELFNRTGMRIYPCGLLENAKYTCPELGISRQGKTWMNYGFTPEFSQGDFVTDVFHLINE